MGGGCRLLRCLTYHRDNALQIPHHVIIGEAEDAVPARDKPSIAAIIVADTFFEIVTFTIDLHDQLA
jgi:hypothetical protein